MPTIKIDKFSGIVPRTGPTQLEGNQAQLAKNIRITSQELRSWKEKTKVFQGTVPGIRSIYKLYNNITGAYRWLEWGTDVDVIQGPVADLTESRIYYTGDGAPKKTNWVLATTSGTGSAPFPDAYLNMGVPNPVAAPTLVASATTTPTEDRAYVYTYVSTFGNVLEESGPSPATNVTVSVTGATVTVSGFSTAPTTNYNITHRRIYRTIVGANSVTFAFVAEIPIATTSYVDNKLVTELGETIQTLNYEPPPSDLIGLVSMANGMVAGFRSNEVWFAEPYLPHAWPSQYMVTVDSEIIGLGVYDTSLVVLTKNRPFILTGTNPESMSQVKLPLNQPCISKRSIASDQFGVLYASPNGLVSIGTGQQDVVTTPLYTRDDWQQLNPASMLGAIWNNLYIGFSQIGGSIGAIVLSRGDIPPLFTLDFPANAVFIDRSNSDLFAVSNFDNAIYQLDSDIVNDTFYEWLSKRFILPNPMSFGALKIKADFNEIGNTAAYNALVAQITAQNQALFTSSGGQLQSTVNANLVNQFVLNGSILQPIPPIATTKSVNVFVYGDGELVWAGGVSNYDVVRLPGDKKYYEFEVRLSGNIPIQLFAMSTNVGELRAVS
jgi:hypothetical protein